jgi:hypothetical protein
MISSRSANIFSRIKWGRSSDEPVDQWWEWISR